MSTFKHKQENFKRMVQRLVDFSGLGVDLLTNVATYASCLPRKGTAIIDEVIFTAQMQKMFELTDSLMVSRLYQVAKNSKDHKGKVTVEDYCKMLCIFLSPDLDRKIDFVFKVYDLDGNDSLGYETEMIGLLRSTALAMIEEMSELDEVLRDISDIVMLLTDKDRNKVITLNEFRELVKRNILTLQFLGSCLPLEKTLNDFVKPLTGVHMDEIAEKFKDERKISLRDVEIHKEGLYPIRLEMV